MTNTPESSGQENNPTSNVGRMLSKEELAVMTENLAKFKEQQNSISKVLSDFDQFKLTSGIRNSEVKILSASPSATTTILEKYASFKNILNQNNGDARLTASQGDAVAKLHELRDIEHKAYTPKAIGEKSEKPGVENNSLDFVEYTKDDHQAIGEEYLSNIEKSDTEENHSDINIKKAMSLAETDAFIMRQQARFREKGLIVDPVIPQGLGVNFDQVTGIESNLKSTEDFEKLAKESLGKTMKSMEQLDSRNEKTKNRLLEMGVTGLVAGLESFKKVSPKHKLIVGLVLASASVASGGLTSIISKGLSTFSYASSHYHEKKKSLEEDGVEVNKRELALQSITCGFILALATSELISLLTPHVPEIIDLAKENFSSVKDGVKDWFASLTDTTAFAPNLATYPINGLTMDDGLTKTGDPGVISSGTVGTGEEIFTSPKDIVILPEYTIKPGDSLTSIIRDKVLPSIPGIEKLSLDQKNNLIENVFKQAAQNKDITFYNTLNQFADRNNIRPGQIVNTSDIRTMLTRSQFNGFGGKTLFEHAQFLPPLSHIFSSSPGFNSPIATFIESVSPQPTVDPSFVSEEPALDATPSSEVLADPKHLSPQEILDLNNPPQRESVQGGKYLSRA